MDSLYRRVPEIVRTLFVKKNVLICTPQSPGKKAYPLAIS